MKQPKPFSKAVAFPYGWNAHIDPPVIKCPHDNPLDLGGKPAPCGCRTSGMMVHDEIEVIVGRKP